MVNKKVPCRKSKKGCKGSKYVSLKVTRKSYKEKVQRKYVLLCGPIYSSMALSFSHGFVCPKCQINIQKVENIYKIGKLNKSQWTMLINLRTLINKNSWSAGWSVGWAIGWLVLRSCETFDELQNMMKHKL